MMFFDLIEGLVPEYKGRRTPYKKSPIDKKTKKRRAKNKAARKSRKINR